MYGISQRNISKQKPKNLKPEVKIAIYAAMLAYIENVVENNAQFILQKERVKFTGKE